MRSITLALALIVAAAGLLACNSNEAARLNPQTSASPRTQPSPLADPADNARRITVAEAHSLLESGKVLFVDTRNEKAFQEGRIKGAVLISMGEIAAKSDELPRDKTIVTYCT
jgi:3-mercaptopyruvate sulfurtransferase SseA